MRELKGERETERERHRERETERVERRGIERMRDILLVVFVAQLY